MINFIVSFCEYLSGFLLVCAIISLIFNPWDNKGPSESNKSRDDDDDDFLLFMDDDDDDDD